MKISALALVAALFVFPLFVGLGARDYQNDEAIYAYSVDKMLERGGWLTPVSIPHEDAPFLEKPPLKLWIVASAMAAGLLPHDEFGMRFWDAVFGGIAFFYVLAIGWKLGGPVAATASVLMLFVHRPLIFEHGLRSHNMEAALVLSYCGGMYHFLQWAGADGRRRPHVFALAGYFVLGFMTKFVAVLFLPLVVAMLALTSRRLRARLLDEWKAWAASAAIVVSLVMPWFVYEYLKYGRQLFDVMFETHVVQRFTEHLDPNHLASPGFYATVMTRHLGEAGILFVSLSGVVLLAWTAARRRRLEAIAVLAWLFVPLASMSLLSSKLYHYAYPFVPPVALAGGYAVAVIALFARGAVRRLAEARKGAGTGAGIRSGSGGWRLAEKLVVAVAVVAVLPLSAYWKTLSELPDGHHPLRSARECLKVVGSQHPGPDGQPPGVWAEGRSFSHSYFYYFRDLGPYVARNFASDATVYVHLYAPWHYRTVLLSYDRYEEFTSLMKARDPLTIERAARKVSLDPSILAAAPGHTPITTIEFPGEVVLLPGPLSVCWDRSR